MRLICRLAILITASALLLCPAHAGTPDAKTAPTRGIAVLASSIGSDFTPESLAEFVRQGKFSPVVVDWAWITFHWNHTDFKAVNRFLELMAAQKVPVAAMYRPRFLSNPSVPTQVGVDGKPGVDHVEICYSDPSAREWGISWGEKILEKCPSFREIIIYNPTNACRCPKCSASRANRGYVAVMGFLSEAKSAWKAKQPAVKLGVVYMPVPEFWKAGLPIIDIAHPYLLIRTTIDPAKGVADIQTVRSIVKEKMGSCLGKITWEPPDKVPIEKLKTVDDLAGKAGIPYTFWTFDTLFNSSLYDPKAVARVMGMDPSAVDKLTGNKPTAAARSTPAPARAVEEMAPSGPPQPPPGPKHPVAKPLPWPFPGGQEDQHIFNNYQQPTDSYIHCALDFFRPAGTPVTAVGPGYVAAIYTNYPQWTTHYFFIVTPKKGGDRGWCYTHLDPQTFTFKEGDFIKQGQLLGKLVKFSIGDKPDTDHLHLHYVTFTKDASGKVDVHSLLDPLYFFDWKDTEPPVFQPLRFVSEGATRQFQADSSGVITVNGKVDILAAITDSAYPGQMGNFGVPVVMLSISDGTHTIQKLVLDHRGDVGDRLHTKPLYFSREEKKAYINPGSFPRYQVLRVTETDGDGKITPKDADECWDTTALDSAGKPLWPDGRYSVNVYAWDIGNNRGVAGAIVQVENEP